MTACAELLSSKTRKNVTIDVQFKKTIALMFTVKKYSSSLSNVCQTRAKKTTTRAEMTMMCTLSFMYGNKKQKKIKQKQAQTILRLDL